jgi:hypothetical protein
VDSIKAARRDFMKPSRGENVDLEALRVTKVAFSVLGELYGNPACSGPSLVIGCDVMVHMVY